MVDEISKLYEFGVKLELFEEDLELRDALAMVRKKFKKDTRVKMQDLHSRNFPPLVRIEILLIATTMIVERIQV
jgi:hypothetical protein